MKIVESTSSGKIKENKARITLFTHREKWYNPTINEGTERENKTE